MNMSTTPHSVCAALFIITVTPKLKQATDTLLLMPTSRWELANQRSQSRTLFLSVSLDHWYPMKKIRTNRTTAPELWGNGMRAHHWKPIDLRPWYTKLTSSPQKLLPPPSISGSSNPTCFSKRWPRGHGSRCWDGRRAKDFTSRSS